MHLLTITFLPGCPMPEPDALFANVPILVRWEWQRLAWTPANEPDPSSMLHLPREAVGCCRLPTPAAVQKLAYLLEQTQTGAILRDLVHEDPAYKQLLLALAGLEPAKASEEWWKRILGEPLRIIGAGLFHSLCATEEGKHNGIGDLIKDFLKKHPRSEKPDHALIPSEKPDQALIPKEPLGCILFHFAQLKPKHPWRGALLMLPWEGIFESESENSLPLQIDRNVVIVRSVDPEPHHKPDELNLDQPLSTVAFTPKYGLNEYQRTFEQQARPYHPVLHTKHSVVWCDCPEPAPGLDHTKLKEQINTYQPQLLHFFGLGDFWPTDEQSDSAHALLIDHDHQVNPGEKQRLGAVELQSFLAHAYPWLFCCFACHAGSTGNAKGLPLTSLSWSLVDALGPHIPALLLMTTKINAHAAGLAGQAWYATCAQGKPLLVALHTMRWELWQTALRPANEPIAHAWWIPALYLRHPRWDRALVDYEAWRQRLMPIDPNAGTEVRLSEPQQEIFSNICKAIGLSKEAPLTKQMVVLHAVDPGSSRTTLLYALYRELEREQAGKVLLFSAKPIKYTDGSDEKPQDRFRLLRMVITSRLRQLRAVYVHWRQLVQANDSEQQTTYIDEIQTMRPVSLWILIDDFEHLTDDEKFLCLHLLEFSKTLPYKVFFVISVQNNNPKEIFFGYDYESISTNEALYKKTYTKYEDLKEYLGKNNDVQRFIIQLLIIAGGVLSKESLLDICTVAQKITNEDIGVSEIQKMVGHGIVNAVQDQHAYQLQLSLLCRNAWDDDRATNQELAKQVSQSLDEWLCQKLRSVSKSRGFLSADAVRLILQRAMRRSILLNYEIVDYNYNDIQKKAYLQQDLEWIYKWWIVVIRSAVRHNMSNELSLYIDRRLNDGTEYSDYDRELLGIIYAWLSDMQHADLYIQNLNPCKHKPKSDQLLELLGAEDTISYLEKINDIHWMAVRHLTNIMSKPH